MWCVLICVEADVMEINLQVVGVKYKHRNMAWGSAGGLRNLKSRRLQLSHLWGAVGPILDTWGVQCRGAVKQGL